MNPWSGLGLGGNYGNVSANLDLPVGKVGGEGMSQYLAALMRMLSRGQQPVPMATAQHDPMADMAMARMFGLMPMGEDRR